VTNGNKTISHPRVSASYKDGASITPAQNPIHKQHLYSFFKHGNHEEVFSRKLSNGEPYFIMKHIPMEAIIK
jgi:hypothetical protein